MIEIRDLFKYYGSSRAVGPVNAEIEPGQVVGLLGLNGAGKTTVLRVLVCDLLPTSGTVRIDGEDVVEAPEKIRAKIGYLPDSPPLYAEMTVREYLGFAGKIRGMKSAELRGRIEAVLGLTETEAVADDSISTLSHGFRQRVGIAQAILHRPRLVVLDEPISGLDPVQIVEMRQLVKALRGEHTVVVSSHILSEISETCDRILVIRGGTIVASGTEAELCSRFLQGIGLLVSVRRSQAQKEDALLASVAAIPGVHQVDKLPPNELGEGITTFRMMAHRDVRDELLHQLLAGGASVLEFSRSQRELENVFLQLSEVEKDSSADSREPAQTEVSL